MTVRLSYFRMDGSYIYDTELQHECASQRELVGYITEQLKSNNSKLSKPKEELFYTVIMGYDGNRWSHPHLFLPVELEVASAPQGGEPLLGVPSQDFILDKCSFSAGKLYDFTHHVSADRFAQLIQEGAISDARLNSGEGRS